MGMSVDVVLIINKCRLASHLKGGNSILQRRSRSKEDVVFLKLRISFSESGDKS
jgi:hypothetical protein